MKASDILRTCLEYTLKGTKFLFELFFSDPQMATLVAIMIGGGSYCIYKQFGLNAGVSVIIAFVIAIIFLALVMFFGDLSEKKKRY